WRLGRVDEVLDEMPSTLAAEARTGYAYGLHTSYALACVCFAHAGDAVAGRRYLDEALATAPPSPDGLPTDMVATAAVAAELAVGLAAVGRSEGRRLLELLGPSGRAAVRATLSDGSHVAGKDRPARALLAAVPAPPPRTTHLAVLGPLTVSRDGPAGEP